MGVLCDAFVTGSVMEVSCEMGVVRLDVERTIGVPLDEIQIVIHQNKMHACASRGSEITLQL